MFPRIHHINLYISYLLQFILYELDFENIQYCTLKHKQRYCFIIYVSKIDTLIDIFIISITIS